MSTDPRSPAHLAVAACLGSALGVTAIPAAGAGDFNLLESKGQVALGTFVNGSKLTIRLDGEAGELGTEVDWRENFGDKDLSRFRLDGLWRFSERHHLRFLYTDYARSKTATFDEDVEWGGEIIPVDAEVQGSLGFEIVELAYEYAFIRREAYELAASIGLHYTTFDASLKATVDLPNGGGTEQRGGTASVDAPLPVIGLHGLWNIGGDFYLDAHAQYFALSIDDLDGDIINYRAALLWQPRKYLGIGAGYDFFKIDIDTSKNRFRGSMEWEYSGPQVFFNFGF
jgi:hypothetical protein